MLDNVFGSGVSNLQSALGRTSQRQNLLMENLANANVPNYKRQDMDFHIQLQDEMGGGMSLGARDGLARLNAANSAIRTDGSNVDPEREVVSIAETEAHYEALTELVSRNFAMLKSAIRGGQ